MARMQAPAVGEDGKLLPDDCITPLEAARLTGKARKTIYKWINTGKLTKYRMAASHEVFVSRKELMAKVALHPVGPIVG